MFSISQWFWGCSNDKAKNRMCVRVSSAKSFAWLKLSNTIQGIWDCLGGFGTSCVMEKSISKTIEVNHYQIVVLRKVKKWRLKTLTYWCIQFFLQGFEYRFLHLSRGICCEYESRTPCIYSKNNLIRHLKWRRSNRI